MRKERFQFLVTSGQVEVRPCTCLGSILQYESFQGQSAPQTVFGGVNFHLAVNMGLRRGPQPKLQNKKHTVYEEFPSGGWRTVADTQAKNSDSESIPNSRP